MTPNYTFTTSDQFGMPLFGTGSTYTVVASVPGEYSVTFGANADHRDCPPPNLSLGTKTVTTATGYNTVEIRYKTFIAPQAVVTPAHPGLLDFFTGDNRWFSFSGTPSRTYQSTIVTVNPVYANGQVGSPTNSFGNTLGYDDEPDGSDVTPCTHCAEDYGDWCFVPGATADCVMTAVPGSNGNILNIQHTRTSNSEVQVQFILVGKNPCSTDILGPDGPAIDANLTIHFRQLCQNGTLGPMEFRLYGTHDGFPWHELYINGTQVYSHDPCCTHETPYSLVGGGEHLFEAQNSCHLQDPPLNVWRQVPGLP